MFDTFDRFDRIEKLMLVGVVLLIGILLVLVQICAAINAQNKVGNVRRDFLHKESTKIAKQNFTVYMEDLNIKGMSANRNLSKHILDCGWGIFKTMLSYKTDVVLVNPKFTSQICNECGAKDKKSRVSQSEFVCTSCGNVSNADVNAAKNIKSRGTALIRKREPTGCALDLEA